MKLTFATLFLLLVLFHVPIKAQTEGEINAFLQEYDISPQTISIHPDGALLISSSYNRELKNNFLIHATGIGSESIQIDTLDVNRPTRSAFSKDGNYILYNEIEETQKTVVRSYGGLNNIGPEFNLTQETGFDAMYYYSLQDSIFAFYTYVTEESPQNGVYISLFDGAGASKPEQLFQNGNNRVFFSPLLLNESTMILAAHGQEDNSTNGVYISRKDEGVWAYPKQLVDIPYGYSFDWVDDETIMYITSGQVNFLDVSELERM